MSRHNNVPPFARVHGANHPAVRPRLLTEIERDVLGYVDKAGHIHYFKEGAEHQEPDTGIDWNSILFWIGAIATILLLGIGGGLWLMS